MGPGWVAGIPGIRVLEALPDGAILELVDGIRPSDVLDAARGAGEVRSFDVVRPSLTEIFRRAVSV